MQLIRYQDCHPVSWKNGGGSTRQLFIYPAQATLDDFDCRISMANVASDGPFSSFPGVDRQLLIVEGAGLALQLAEQNCLLTTDSAALSFAGETPVDSRLLGGPVVDFNVMTRRGRCQAPLDFIELEKTLQLPAHQSTRLMLVLDNEVQLQAGQHKLQLRRWDSALIPRDTPLEMSANLPTRLLQVSMQTLSELK